MNALGLVVSGIVFYFSYCKSTGTICCHRNQRSDTAWKPFPHFIDLMFQIKFDRNLPVCGLELFMCEMTHRRTPVRVPSRVPFVTSCELIMHRQTDFYLCMILETDTTKTNVLCHFNIN